MFWFKRWRRRRAAGRVFPQEWLSIIERNVPFYRRLSHEDQKELLGHILIFLNEKRFEGCGGLKMTDEIKITIAAQACILLLHRRTDYYPGLSSILVYPEAYVANHTEYLADGTIAEGPDVLMGESWHHGSVVLSWNDVRRGSADIHDGHNVVFHEFAHQLDSSEGKGDSSEVLANSSSFIAWARVLQKEYQNLRSNAGSGRPTFLDQYGATNPAEFFAVVTEYFFKKSRELQKLHPQLYEELKRFYQQDPASL